MAGGGGGGGGSALFLRGPWFRGFLGVASVLRLEAPRNQGAIDPVLYTLHARGHRIHHFVDALAVSRQVVRNLLALQISPSPAKYNITSAMVQTTKLARPRGKRSFMKNSTTGSSRKAIIAAMITVMKKTRPKYSRAIARRGARIPTPDWSDACCVEGQALTWTTTFRAPRGLCLSL